MTTAAQEPDKEMREKQAVIERAWASLPSSYAIPEVAPTLDEARAWCQRLAESHYENFHVASWFLPKDLRPHFHAIYAYCRVSDDLGDELGDPEQSLALLDIWGRELDACYEGRARHPVFVALAETIKQCFIPKEPFADLLVAFRQDQTVTRYETMEDLLGYCRNSANPVGRLVLYACGESNEENVRLSDLTCSALQLANFWQDVRADIKRGRIYIPKKDMDFFRVSEEYIAEGIVTPEFRGLMVCEIDYTRSLFEQGLPLIGKVLRAIERCDYDVLSARPAISKAAKLALLLRAVSGKLLPFLRLGNQRRGAED
jgi:squalene synthase HpnC